MHRKLATAALAAFMLALLPATSFAAVAAAPQADASTFALFEGKLIDLSQGWSEAQACFVDQSRGVIECFRDRADLQIRETQIETQTNAPATITATCSSPLRLFADASYGGRELDFYDRGYWQNLSTWGFDNQLSSYKVGACGVYLADSANGGGSWYPGSTSAGHSEPSMVSGWNDRVSSIYIQ
jgi:hypothetical protein